MPRIVIAILAGLVLLVSLGCPFVDQRIDLTYQRIVNAHGGSGEIFIAKPKEQHSQQKKSGQLIIGEVITGFGAKGADVVTNSDAGDWIVAALMQELSFAGTMLSQLQNCQGMCQRGLI